MDDVNLPAGEVRQVQTEHRPRPTVASAQPRWNALATVSFVTALLGLSVVGVICGHIGLSQIRRSSEQGRGLAIAGLVLGYLGILAWAGFWILAVMSWGLFAWNATVTTS